MPSQYEDQLFYEAYPVYLLQNLLTYGGGILWGVLVAVIGLLLVLRAKEPLVGFRWIGIGMMVWGITGAIGYFGAWIEWAFLFGVMHEVSPSTYALQRFLIDAGEWAISVACLGLVGAGLLSLLKALQSV